MKAKAGTIIKTIITVILCCLAFLVAYWGIVTHFYIPAYGEAWFYKIPRISEDHSVTFNQDLTIVNSGDHNSKVTFEKGTVIISNWIQENGVLYSETVDEVHYHEWISLDNFVEGEDLKAELKAIDEQNKIKTREIMTPAYIKVAVCLILYLAIAVPLIVVLLKKGKRKTCVLLNVVLMLLVYVLLQLLSIMRIY